MSKKLKIGLIFGGKSGEHEISLISAWSIYNALDKNKYDVKLLGIDKKGVWRLGNGKNFWINPKNAKKVKLNLNSPEIIAVNRKEKVQLVNLKNGDDIAKVDVFFPVTHGTFGEDGCLQGFLELLGAAYVGAGVLGSAVGMDKDLMKRILRDAKIPIAKFYVLRKPDIDKKNISFIVDDLRFPIFVKPAGLGSSVGISKVRNTKDLHKAIKTAFCYDTKIILEEFVNGREIECGVLEFDHHAIASIPGEIKLKPKHYYSYQAKYIDETIAAPSPKADLPKNMTEKIQKKAIEVFRLLNCEGMGRVDFFLTQKGKLYVNEINTLPGFTNISMYPKMFEESGIPYSKLLDRLIQFAIKRKKRNDKISRSFEP